MVPLLPPCHSLVLGFECEGATPGQVAEAVLEARVRTSAVDDLCYRYGSEGPGFYRKAQRVCGCGAPGVFVVSRRGGVVDPKMRVRGRDWGEDQEPYEVSCQECLGGVVDAFVTDPDDGKVVPGAARVAVEFWAE